MKRILTIAGLLFGWLLALPALAQTVTLNFDDGTAGSLVGGHYSAQGITFQDARWVNMGSGLPGMSGTMGINHATGSYEWGPSTPVIATFAQPASSVSVDGIDVGTQGLVITAFDAPTGGTQLATQQVFGTGVGIGQFYTVTVTGANIRRVEISQVTTGSGDGMLLDNFRVTFAAPAVVTPVPTLELGGLAGLVALIMLGTALQRKRTRN
ncbi:MAG TPA: hypothetical protein PKM77_06525 [Ottowia sp.]|nr:hypothetical protein [Ottowia sp.]